MHWRTIGASVRGADHVRTGLPNQDALECWPRDGGRSPVIACVSDGHGGARYFRSAVGATLAARVAAATLRDMAAAPELLANAPRRIVEAWQAAVEKHLRAHPFEPGEWERLPPEEAEEAWQQIEMNPLVAYGATLLCALAVDSRMSFLQLGDGDILRVDEEGNTERPLRADATLTGNETTSLCLPEAWNEFRTVAIDPGESSTALVLLSTDGYANSFCSDADFLQIGADYLTMLRESGPAGVSRGLDEILEDASRGGSGDDITLVLLHREKKPKAK